MRVRAAQEFSFDHSGNNKIAGVPGFPGNLLGAVNARHRCADDGKIALNLQVTTFLFAENPSELCSQRHERRFKTVAAVEIRAVDTSSRILALNSCQASSRRLIGR